MASHGDYPPTSKTYWWGCCTEFGVTTWKDARSEESTVTERKASGSAAGLGDAEYVRWLGEVAAASRVAPGASRPAAKMAIVSTTLGLDLDAELKAMAEKIRSHAETPLALKVGVHSLMRDALRGAQMGQIIPKRPTDFKRTRHGMGMINRTVSVFPHEKARLLLICKWRRANPSQLIRAVVRRYLLHAHRCSPVLGIQLKGEFRLGPWPFYGNPKSYCPFSLRLGTTLKPPKGVVGGGTVRYP